VQNGTSFASAFVAGVAALVRSAHPELNPAQVVARIEATAHGPAGPGTGHGLVDPVRAVTAVLPAESPSTGSTSTASTSTASTSTHTVAVIAGSFGLVVVVIAAVLAVSAARRRRTAKPPGAGSSGRHAR
jgi:membrane-anchored mycosin MYCP